jgi:hypothetical protein
MTDMNKTYPATIRRIETTPSPSAFSRCIDDKRKHWAPSGKHSRPCLSASLATATATLVFFLLQPALSAHAQMQIPNPLLQPQRAKMPIVPPGPPPASGISDNIPSPFSPMSLDGANRGGQQNDALREIRDRFSGFHVSAILGNQAVLRRDIGTIRMSVAPVNAGSSIGSTPQQPIGAQNTGGRSETFLVVDGEMIEFVGEAVALVPRITANRVFIYFVDNTKTTKDKPARNPVVFIGEVESSEATSIQARTLEKPDSTYRQSISVQAKSTAASALQGNQPQQQLPLNP